MTQKLDGKFIGEIRRATTGEVIPDDRWVAFMAYDNAFVGTLKYYRNKCQQLGCTQEQLSAVDALILRVDQWRADNPELCRKPDSVRTSGTSMVTPPEVDDAAVFGFLQAQQDIHNWLRQEFHRELNALNPAVANGAYMSPPERKPEVGRVKFEKLFDIDDMRAYKMGMLNSLSLAMREFAIAVNDEMLKFGPTWPILLHPVLRQEAYMIELQWVCQLFEQVPVPAGQVVKVEPLPAAIQEVLEQHEEPLAAERTEE